MKQLFFLILLLLFTLAVYPQNSNKAQNKLPDFTGTWILDKDKSGMEGAMSFAKSFSDITLVIEHIEPEMRIVQKIKTPEGKENTQTIVLFTDGRRKASNGKNDENNFVMYNWKENTLVKTAKFVIGKGEGWDWLLTKNKKDSLKMENREEWKLSKDGKTLTQRTFGGTTPDVPMLVIFKYIYRRQN